MTDWTPHNGGPCPVDPDAMVEVKFRNVDWLRGWDDVQDDYNAEGAGAKWRKGQKP